MSKSNAEQLTTLERAEGLKQLSTPGLGCAISVETVREVLHYARLYKADVRLRQLSDCQGRFFKKTSRIEIDYTHDRNTILSALFHELGHLYCQRNGLFFAYHRPKIGSRRSLLAMRRTALRAELWVDRWAEREFTRQVPNGHYQVVYRDSASRQSLRQQKQEVARSLGYRKSKNLSALRLKKEKKSDD